MVRSMLNGKGSPNSFWAEAVNTTVYILNTSVMKAVEGKTPQEAYSGKKPSVSHLKVFESECCMHIRDERTKLALKSRKCIFLGYDMESKLYRIYDPEARKVLLIQDVLFQEQLQQMEDKRPSPSLSEITCTHDERPTKAKESAPSP